MAAKKKKQTKLKKLLFVDTNKWLDFYRARNEAGLGLLHHLDQLRDSIIVTDQLEMEFKKNRHSAIREGMSHLKSPERSGRPGLFSNDKAVEMIEKAIKQIDGHSKKLRERLARVISNPSQYDPVYQVCHRVFHRESAIVLTRENELYPEIRERALDRFHLGCPPRKTNDTSIGDAINWEWMIECAIQETAELVIVSRDSDYGQDFDDQTYLNDHLKQEFSERVSKKRQVLLYRKISDALKHFKVEVSDAEVKEEEAVIVESTENALPTRTITAADFTDKSIFIAIEKIRAQLIAEQETLIRDRAELMAQILRKPHAGSDEH
jgi:hypothetical protein